MTGKRDPLHFNPIRVKALSLEQLQVNPVQPIECSFAAACGFAATLVHHNILYFTVMHNCYLRFKTSQINIRTLQNAGLIVQFNDKCGLICFALHCIADQCIVEGIVHCSGLLCTMDCVLWIAVHIIIEWSGLLQRCTI